MNTKKTLLVFFLLISGHNSNPFMPVFKHKNDINIHAQVNCPPIDAVEKEQDAYRFVNEPITNNDFLPHTQLGMAPRQTSPSHEKCSRCALSMFSSIESAQKTYDSIPKKSKFRYTHIAKGLIIKPDGILHPPVPNGHFDFFEYDGVDLTGKFSIIKPLS